MIPENLQLKESEAKLVDKNVGLMLENTNLKIMLKKVKLNAKVKKYWLFNNIWDSPEEEIWNSL